MEGRVGGWCARQRKVGQRKQCAPRDARRNSDGGSEHGGRDQIVKSKNSTATRVFPLDPTSPIEPQREISTTEDSKGITA